MTLRYLFKCVEVKLVVEFLAFVFLFYGDFLWKRLGLRNEVWLGTDHDPKTLL